MVSVWGLTDKGIVRRENQDSCAYETIPERGLAWGVVCDGMGGAKAGDIASKLAVETFRTHLEDLRGPDLPGETGKLLLAAAEDANRVVYHKASTDDACIGMGTTLVGLILQGETLEVVNVGDSRAYLIRPDGIRRITRDHSVVEDHHRQRRPDPGAGPAASPEKPHYEGLGDLAPREGGPLPRDRCAGGCAPAVLRRSHQRGHRSGDPKGSSGRRLPQEICQRLVARTLDHGAPDNVTVVLFQL